MNELMEFLETLKSIQALPEPMQPAAVDRAVEKYEQEVKDLDRAMSAQHDLFFGGTVFIADESFTVDVESKKEARRLMEQRLSDDGYFEYPTPT